MTIEGEVDKKIYIICVSSRLSSSCHSMAAAILASHPHSLCLFPDDSVSLLGCTLLELVSIITPPLNAVRHAVFQSPST